MPTFRDFRGAAAPDPRRTHQPEPAVVGDAFIGRASGKAILFGEHAVVHGEPAIAIPLDSLSVQVGAAAQDGETTLVSKLYSGSLRDLPLRLAPVAKAIEVALHHVDGVGVDLHIVSNLPEERGVGSSAAVASAVIAAIVGAYGGSLTDAEHFELTQAAERVAHGTPSGLDAHTVRAARPVWFEGGIAQELDVAMDATFVLADTGKPGRTAQAVAGVRERLAAYPEDVGGVLHALGDRSRAAKLHFAQGDAGQLGAEMTHAHALLSELGVSDPALDKLVDAAASAGALGAKLTGGGLGGYMIALAPSPDGAAHIVTALNLAGAADVWTTGLRETQ